MPLIAILGIPFKCPPAPYEGAFLLHDYLVDRAVRDATQIHVISPMDSPIPVSRETSEAIVRALGERDIGHTPSRRVSGLDPSVDDLDIYLPGVVNLSVGSLVRGIFGNGCGHEH